MGQFSAGVVVVVVAVVLVGVVVVVVVVVVRVGVVVVIVVVVIVVVVGVDVVEDDVGLRDEVDLTAGFVEDLAPTVVLIESNFFKFVVVAIDVDGGGCFVGVLEADTASSTVRTATISRSKAVAILVILVVAKVRLVIVRSNLGSLRTF